jgi:hypothetical protein
MLALVGFIALATYFFEIQIRNSMLARSFQFNTGWVFQGTYTSIFYNKEDKNTQKPTQQSKATKQS